MIKRVWLYPNSIERKLIRSINEEITALIKEYYKRLKGLKRFKKDDEEYTEEDSDEIETAMLALAAWWFNRVSAIRIKIVFLFGDLNKFNDKQFINIIKILTGVTLPTSQTVAIVPNETVTNIIQARRVLGAEVDLNRIEPFITPAKSNFVSGTVNSISGLGNKLIIDLESLTRLGLQQSLTEKELREAVAKKLPQLDRTINNLSREIITKINSELTKNRQISMGFSRYVWNTQLDERVRPAHRLLEGTVHSWDNAPSEGHPGSAYLCRCWATPTK